MHLYCGDLCIRMCRLRFALEESVALQTSQEKDVDVDADGDVADRVLQLVVLVDGGVVVAGSCCCGEAGRSGCCEEAGRSGCCGEANRSGCCEEAG